MIRQKKRLESEIQAEMIAKLETEGYYVIRLMSTNKNGIPDLLALKGGRGFFLEMKRRGKKPEELQCKRAKELKAVGFPAYWADSVGELKEFPSMTITEGLGF